MNKFVVSLLLVHLLGAVPAFAKAQAKTIHEQAVKAVSIEASAQKKYQNWMDTKNSESDEIREMKATEAWLIFQNKKYQKYIEKQNKVIAELNRRKLEAKKIKMELEPFLEVIVDKLDMFVKSDLPFLEEERTNRINFLRDSLNDYHLEVSEKLRRVFEALLIETEYGRNVSTSTKELVLNGTPTQVTLFRLGRTALYYQTTDGSEVGIWNNDTKEWNVLDHKYALTLNRAKDMADRKRAVELLELPMRATK